MNKRVVVVLVALAAVLAVALLVWPRRPKPAASGGEAAEPSKEETLARMRAARGAGSEDATPGSAAGTVRRKADGAPVAGAVVLLSSRELGPDKQPPGEAPAPRVARTDEAGAWLLADVPPGRYAVSATAAGFAPASRRDVTVTAGRRTDGLDLLLDAGGAALQGSVSDVGGGAVAGAVVQATPTSGGALLDLERPTFAALTDDAGHYRLELADGSYSVSAWHVDYAGDHDEVRMAGQPRTLDFILTPGSVIQGRVLARSDRRPVAGAIVSSSGGRSSGKGFPDFAAMLGGAGAVVTDSEGRFTLRGLGSGAVELEAVARAYATREPVVVELGIGEHVTGVEVLVDGAYTISGFVVRKDDQSRGVPNVIVGGLNMRASFTPTGFDTTDGHGYFEILGVRPGTYSMVALVDGLMPSIFQTTVVVSDADVNDVLVVLDTGATLSGRVEPPGPARLSLQVDTEEIGLTNLFNVAGAALVRGEAGEDGQFVMRAVPSGKYTLVARAPDGSVGELPVKVTGDDQSGLVVRLEGRARVAGRVVDATGAPVAGLRVELDARAAKRQQLDFGEMMDDAGRTGEDGRFEVLGLEAGKYGLTVHDEHGPLAWADGVARASPYEAMELELAAREEKTGLELRVEAKNGVIRGTVVGPNGAPVADAWVVARVDYDRAWRGRPPPEAASGGDGDGQTTVTVSVGSSSGASVESSEGGEDDEERGGWTSAERPVLTDAEGRFAVKGLRQGTYAVTAEGLSGTAQGFKKGVHPGETITIPLLQLGSLEGTVTAGGQPVAEYNLAVEGPTRRERRISDAAGAYRLARLAAGKYQVKVTTDGGAAMGEVTVTPGETARLDLALSGWGAVSGVVVDAATGKPLGGMLVVARSDELHDDADMAASFLTGGGPRTDGQGRFKVGKVGPGKGHLIVIDAGLTGGFTVVAEKRFTLAVAQELDLGTVQGLLRERVPAAERGDLGLTTTELRERLVVDAVREGGPAAQAGLKPGEVVVSVDGFTVEALGADVIDGLLGAERVRAGQTVTVGVVREGKTVEVPVTAAPHVPAP